MKIKAESIFLLFMMLVANLGIINSQELYFNQVIPPPESPSWGLITDMMQDRSGYMWFATGNQGVQRFDGYEFKSYVNEERNPNSIATNNTECIMEDSEGIIWIGTTGAGLERLDPLTGMFTHYTHNPNDPESIIHNDVKVIFEDHEGVLWIGTREGLEIFDRKSKKFRHFTTDINDSSTISNNCVKDIYEDSENTLWFGTGEPWDGANVSNVGGLNRYNKITGDFTRYLHDENDSLSLIDNRVTAIYEDSKGNFWVCTVGDGLHLMDRKKGTFQRYSYDPETPDNLSRPGLQEVPFPGALDHISFIHEDKSGELWIGTMGAGINRYNPKTQKVTHYGGDQSEGGLKDIYFWSSYISRDGVIWISSVLDNKLYRVNPLQTRFDDINVGTFAISMFQDHPDIMWLGTLNGMVKRDLKTGLNIVFQHDSLVPSSIGQGPVRDIVSADGNKLWVASHGGLNLFDPKTNSFVHFRHDENDDRSIDNDTIGVLHKDRSSNLWVGTPSGLNKLEPNSEHFIHYQPDPLDDSSISDSEGVWRILEDEDQKYLWVGNIFGGLDRLDIAKGKFDHFLPEELIFSIIQDQSGVVWVSSDQGLYRFKKDQEKFEMYTDPNGIFNFERTGLELDSQNNIWFLREAGVGQINSDRSEIYSYTKSNGKNLARVSRNILKDFDGNLCFSYYPERYARITPENLKRTAEPPLILIKDFKLELESVLPREGSPIDVPINEETEINLNHDQNIFSFDFVAIDYTSPEDNRLFFKLENYDKDWRGAGLDKTVQYINIPPGDYSFRVKAATNMGVFTEREIKININPPWWLTWWAYLIYGFGFLVGVYSVHRIQKARLIKVEREKARDKELAQAREIEKAYTKLQDTQAQLIQSEKMASLGELTAGIAHEIQNPLNFVKNFSEVSTELIDEMIDDLKSGKQEDAAQLATEIKENQERINHHGKRAGSIVRGMLQHSRTSSGELVDTDINNLCDEYLRLSYHGLRAKDKSFNADLKTALAKDLPKVKVVPQDFGRVLLNLINNAFYAVKEKSESGIDNFKPTVEVSTKLLKNKVEIKVVDNGNGVPEEVQEKIFQPFFTTKPSGKGTGLGLSLSYDIVKAHGGELRLETKEGKGSEFIIKLPV